MTVDGAPVAGAEVSLFVERRTDPSAPFLWLSPGARPSTSGADGVAVFSAARDGFYEAVARATGLVTSSSTRGRCGKEQEALLLSVTLARADVCFSGRIIDRDGGPLAESWAYLDKVGATESLVGHIPMAVDGDGRFTVCAPDGTARWGVVAGAVGYEAGGRLVDPEAAASEMIIELRRASVLQGRVSGPAGPVEGVVVFVTGPGRGATSSIAETRTDAEGRFVLPSGPGTAVLSAWSEEGWAMREVPARAEAQDAEDLDLLLQPGRTVTGTCLDGTGTRLPNLPVCFWSNTSSFGTPCVRTDGTGRFTIHNLPPGEEMTLWSPVDRRPLRESRVLLPSAVSEVAILVEPRTGSRPR